MKIEKIVVKGRRYELKCAKPLKNTHSISKNNQFRLYLTKKVKIKRNFKQFWLILGGALIGVLNGFFGGGGGMMAVPILEKILSLSSKEAHATAISVIFPLSLISASIYVFNGYIKTFPLLFVTIGVVLGGIFGSFALKFLPSKMVRIVFAIIMLIGGLKLVL